MTDYRSQAEQEYRQKKRCTRQTKGRRDREKKDKEVQRQTDRKKCTTPIKYLLIKKCKAI